MTRSRLIHLGLQVLLVLGVLGMWFFPWRSPVAIVGSAVLTLGVGGYLGIRDLYDDWAEGAPDPHGRPRRFVLARIGGILFVIGFLGLFCLGSVLFWLGIPEGLGAVVWPAMGLLGIAMGIGGLIAVARREDDLRDLRKRLLPAIPPRTLLREALAFWRTSVRVYLGQSVRLALIGILLLVLAGVMGYLACWGGWFLAGRPRPVWTSANTWVLTPFLLTAAVFFFLVSSWALTELLIVDLARSKGLLGQRSLNMLLDRAMGSVGFFPSVIVSTLLAIVLGVLFFASGQFALWASEFGMNRSILHAAAGIVLTWALVLFPTMWVLPLMVRHDCGWSRGLPASVSLVLVEPGRALFAAVTASVLALTIVGIPAAAYLLLRALDDTEPLAKVFLGETPLRLLERELDQDAKAFDHKGGAPKMIVRGYEKLDSGRYLEALNIFQMFLRQDFGNLDALRGETLSYLMMGNTLHAREKLERWRQLDPENDEPKRLEREMREGLWSEGGDRFEEAKAKCTQDIGRGITTRETHGLEPEDIPDTEERLP